MSTRTTVLKIDSSARLEGSNSRLLTNYLVEQLGDVKVIERDLVRQPLPPISAEDLVGVHGSSAEERDSLKQQLDLSQELIGELFAADTLVVGVPMYNFSVPAALKQWIDYVCRARVTFRYTEQGPEGLTGIKRAYIVTATGGTPVGSPMDHASGYVEQILKFIGVDEIHHVEASGSKGDPERILAEAKGQIDSLLQNRSVSQAQAAEA